MASLYEPPATKEARWHDFLRRLREADKELPPIRPIAPKASGEQLVADQTNPPPGEPQAVIRPPRCGHHHDDVCAARSSCRPDGCRAGIGMRILAARAIARQRWSNVTRLPGIFGGGDIIEGEHSMQNLKTAFAVAFAVGSLSSIAGTANAANVATGMSTAADRLTLVDQVEFVFGGRKHCWYPEGWHGAGWYWCGYADEKHKGRGWGGPEGYRGWKH